MFPFDIPSLKKRIQELETRAGNPDFWNDPDAAQKVMQEIDHLKDRVSTYDGLASALEDLNVLTELGLEEDEESVSQEVEEGLAKLRSDVENFKLVTMLGGRYDRNDCIVSLHAGAGGTEAQDWVAMLYRMYTRWAERHNFKVETADILPGEEAGIKSVTFMVSGENAYGYLKAEKGVHRLVRISPFDASGRRHTSFASVDVLPEIEDDGEIEIRPEDLKIDTYRSGGAGGQHVNKTESAIRITHIPTGIVVQCQNERSQHNNRLVAMRILKARLHELKEEEQRKQLGELRGEQKEIAWGSQIRSYVFHPYSLVKDHRTSVEVGNVQAVMDGEIDIFINEYLKKTAREQQ